MQSIAPLARLERHATGSGCELSAISGQQLRQERLSDSQACEQSAASEGREVVLVGPADALDEPVYAQPFEQARDLADAHRQLDQQVTEVRRMLYSFIKKLS